MMHMMLWPKGMVVQWKGLCEEGETFITQYTKTGAGMNEMEVIYLRINEKKVVDWMGI